MFQITLSTGQRSWVWLEGESWRWGGRKISVEHKTVDSLHNKRFSRWGRSHLVSGNERRCKSPHGCTKVAGLVVKTRSPKDKKVFFYIFIWYHTGKAVQRFHVEENRSCAALDIIYQNKAKDHQIRVKRWKQVSFLGRYTTQIHILGNSVTSGYNSNLTMMACAFSPSIPPHTPEKCSD